MYIFFSFLFLRVGVVVCIDVVKFLGKPNSQSLEPIQVLYLISTLENGLNQQQKEYN